jgi:acetyl-CoA synthetase
MTSILGIAGEPYIWEPTPAVLEHARATAFMREHDIDDWRELIRRSHDDVEWFWDAAVRFLGIEFARPYERVLDTSRGLAWATWFSGGALNLTHNCVDRHPGGRPAVVWESEDGRVERATYGELAAETNRLANALLELGVGRGDAVGLFLPMSIQAVAGFYAICKIGAIVVPIFSGFAAPAVAARLADAGAVALLTADAVPRRGRPVSMKGPSDAAVAEVPSVRAVVVWDRLGTDPPMREGRDHRWDELVGRQSPELEAPALDAETPMMVIYTSGTTGRPKGAVHVHGGFVVKIAEEAAFQGDVHADDRVMWVTDMGWIMGPWVVVGAGAAGATLVVSEGAPDYPGPGRLWELVERHRISVLGVSPTLIRALRSHGEEPVRAHDRSSLRVLGSTGEPWNPEPWWWFFREVGAGRCPIVNYSGGTEVAGGIVGGNVIGPIKPASFSGPCIGTAADVVDDAGSPVRGRVGELVIRAPMPGMTRGFWNDRERYEGTYWSRWPGLWAHGDWASIDADGFWYIHGRSDDTLKVAGKRVGPAEVESAAVAHPAVLEAAAIGVPHDIKGEAIVVLCVLRPGETDDEALRASVAQRIADELGKPLRPEAVAVVRALPKTRSGKVMRRVIRAAWLDQDPGDLSALDDPAVVEAIRGAGSTR